MEHERGVLVGAIIGLAVLSATIAPAAGLSLSQEGVTFPDGTVQTTAATNEVAGTFQAEATVEMTSNFVAVFWVPVVDVPDGYRAVVEFVSVTCNVPTGPAISAGISVTKLTSPSTSVSRRFQVPLSYHGNDPFEGPTYIGSLMTRLYADRNVTGGGITAFATRESGTGTAYCYVNINGRFLPIPPNEALTATPAVSSPVQEIVVPYTPGPPPPEVLNPPPGTVVKVMGPPDE